MRATSIKLIGCFILSALKSKGSRMAGCWTTFCFSVEAFTLNPSQIGSCAILEIPATIKLQNVGKECKKLFHRSRFVRNYINRFIFQKTNPTMQKFDHLLGSESSRIVTFNNRSVSTSEKVPDISQINNMNKITII